jgi:hypothetical protein
VTIEGQNMHGEVQRAELRIKKELGHRLIKRIQILADASFTSAR